MRVSNRIIPLSKHVHGYNARDSYETDSMSHMTITETLTLQPRATARAPARLRFRNPDRLTVSCRNFNESGGTTCPKLLG